MKCPFVTSLLPKDRSLQKACNERAFHELEAGPKKLLTEDRIKEGKTPEERRESMDERTVAVSTKDVVEAGLLKNRLYFIDCNTAQADAIREANDKWLELFE